MRTDIRPWGRYQVLLDSEDCKVKKIWVEPGHRLSYQYHHQRSEVWTIVSGEGILTLDGKETQVGPGTVVQIPLKAKHRIHNSGQEQLVFVETQLGTYFGEDDIVRIEDDYER